MHLRSLQVRYYWLRANQWTRIKSLLPGKTNDRGVTALDYRLFVEAVLWISRTGPSWRGLPELHGHWPHVYVRYNRWSQRRRVSISWSRQEHALAARLEAAESAGFSDLAIILLARSSSKAGAACVHPEPRQPTLKIRLDESKQQIAFDPLLSRFRGLFPEPPDNRYFAGSSSRFPVRSPPGTWRVGMSSINPTLT